MRRAALCGVLALAMLPVAAARADTSVDAAGNPFLGGLAYAPDSVDVTEGDTVTWTNTDILVPHTVTEDHGLFELAGTYPPLLGGVLFPAGFGPSEHRSLTVAAGTFHYFCEVHPTQMHGVVAAAMRLSMHSEQQQAQAAQAQGGSGGKKKKHKKRKHRKHHKGRSARAASSRATETHFIVTAVWASAPLPSDQVFDVEEQIGSGAYTRVADGTSALQGDFDAGTTPGTVVNFRARVRRSTDQTASSDWSPVATITTG